MDSLSSYLEAHQLELVQSSDPLRGRSVLAKSLIKRGSTVITSQPLGTVPCHDNKRDICNYCFQKPKSVASRQQCSRCKKAYFCGAKCFKNAWKSYHQFVCGAPAANPEDQDDDNDVEMLERVALNMDRFHAMEESQPNIETEGADEDIHATMQAFTSLMDHRSKQPKHVLERYKRLADRALRKPYMQKANVSRLDLVQLLCRFGCNNFSITDENLFTIGEGTYPIGSLFNHACRPNAVAIFDGALLKMVAIDDIAENTEVTIAYTDAAHSRTYRKKSLLEKYFFSCDCARCDDSSQFGQIDALLGEEESEWDRAQAALDGASSAQRIHLQKQVEQWDLVDMVHRSNDVEAGHPMPEIAVYSHHLIQMFIPGLWSSTLPSSSLSNGSPSAIARPESPVGCKTLMDRALHYAASYPQDGSSPTRLSTLTAATRLLYDNIANGYWHSAVKLGMYVLAQYALLYPPFHPMVAHHLLVLSKATWNAQVQSETGETKFVQVYQDLLQPWIILCQDTIACTFGTESGPWAEIVDLERHTRS